MARNRPPQQEHIQDGRRFLVLFVDPVNSLSLDAHLLIQPFLAITKAPQKASLLLKLAGADYFLSFGIECPILRDNWLPLHLWIRGPRFEIMGSLDIVRTPDIGLVAVNEIRHPEERRI